MSRCECKVCGHPAREIFSAEVLNKYSAAYLKCSHCDFIFVKDPSWLDEAYTRAIADCDTGRVHRSLLNRSRVLAVITSLYKKDAAFVDWGGGDGLLSRFMRDIGFDFLPFDKYAENIFTRGLGDANRTEPECITAFEVVEHLTDPIPAFLEVSGKFRCTEILFSTTLMPAPEPDKSWWYYSFDTGQHVSFYSKRTLKEIALRLGVRYIHLGGDLHLFTKHRVPLLLKLICKKQSVCLMYGEIQAFLRRKKSLILKDHWTVKAQLSESRHLKV